MKRMLKTGLSLVLALLLVIQFAGCSVKAQASDLMKGITPGTDVTSEAWSAESEKAAADFAIRLFQAGLEEGKNTLLSPLSVMTALSMTANGARNETLRQMEQVLGMTVGELNGFSRNYVRNLPFSDRFRLRSANSVWFKADRQLSVSRDFLQANADHYGADAYEAPFDDSTLRDINNWVKDRTGGMIPEILDEIPQNAVMYLINALAFEAEWQEVYEENDLQTGLFTCEDGSKRTVELMFSQEYRYLETPLSKGFIKEYKGNRYAFAALLPNQGVKVSELAASLDGRALHDLLKLPMGAAINAAVPKFETSASAELSAVLSDMGMPDAFLTQKADFSGIGSYGDVDLVLSRVLHKASISVNEQGTKAGAASAVEVMPKSANPEDIKVIRLDRPFIYMLIDMEAGIPFFIGSMMDPGK